MAHGVKDPVDSETQLARSPLPGVLKTVKDGLECMGIKVAPHIDDAHGDVDLGVNDALRSQPLHHAPGYQLVVVGADQPPGHGLEGLDKAGEIVEIVVGIRLGRRHGMRIVAST